MGKAILKRVGIGVGGATLLVIVVSLFLPSTFTVTRSRVIGAGPEAIHPFLDDLERWPEWTPWLEADPTLVVELDATTSGVGASQRWSGDSGGGQLSLTRSEPQWGVAYTMAFSGDQYPSEGSIRFEDDPGGTLVVWEMVGDLGWNPLERYFGLALGGFIGPMFEDGLVKLEAAVVRADSLSAAP